MTIKTLRVVNETALRSEPITELIDRAYTDHAFTTKEQAHEQLAQYLQSPTVSVLVAKEGDGYKGLVVMATPPGGVATVQHFYCQKAPKVRENMIETLVKIALAAGCNTLLTVDANRKPRAFRQLFRKAGTSREVGRVFEFDLTTAEAAEV